MSRRPSPHLHLVSFRFLVVPTDPCLIKTPTLFIYSSIYLFIYLFICLFIYLFIQILRSYPLLTYCRGWSNSQMRGAVNFRQLSLLF